MPPIRPVAELPEEVARLAEDAHGLHSLSDTQQHDATIARITSSEYEGHVWHANAQNDVLHGQASSSSLPPLASPRSFPNAHEGLMPHPSSLGESQNPAPLQDHIFDDHPNAVARHSDGHTWVAGAPFVSKGAFASGRITDTIRPDVLLEQGIWGHHDAQPPLFPELSSHFAASPPQAPPPYEGMQPQWSTGQSSSSELLHSRIADGKSLPTETNEHTEQILERIDITKTPRGFLSGFNYLDGKFRTVVQPDVEVDLLITRLRSRALLEAARKEQALSIPLQTPVELLRSKVMRPDSLAIRSFWNQAHIKEVAFQGQHGARRLLLSFSHRPNIVVHKTGRGLLGVWELSREQLSTVQQQDPSKLYLRGFYQFTPGEFANLGRHPETTGNQYWMVTRKTTNKNVPDQALRLMIKRIDDSEAELLAGSRHPPEIQQDLLPSDFDGGIEKGRAVPGRHLYVYHESPEVAMLTQAWKREAMLDPSAFRPIQLTQEQKEHLDTHVARSFRQQREVKMFDLPNGRSLMLVFSTRTPWLTQHPLNTVSIWEFGPVVGEERVLTALGYFHLQPLMWRNLTPRTIKGLRMSVFQYSNLNSP